MSFGTNIMKAVKFITVPGNQWQHEFPQQCLKSCNGKIHSSVKGLVVQYFKPSAALVLVYTVYCMVMTLSVQ